MLMIPSVYWSFAKYVGVNSGTFESSNSEFWADLMCGEEGMSHVRDDCADTDIEYTDDFVAKLELLWGDGFLSPGGEKEVATALAGVDLAGKDILDVGCGVGGVDILLARRWNANSVLGIDIEAPVLAKAEARVRDLGLTDRISYRQVEPGPFPLPDAGFDVVFSKDAMIHIPDKAALYADVLRVLRPGGVFVASDWLKGFERPDSSEMSTWLDSVALHFEMASIAATERALTEPVVSETDVSSLEELRALFADTETRFGRLDVLHNNAGLGEGPPDWPGIDSERALAICDVNLRAVVLGTQLALGPMQRSGGGVVVNTASGAAFVALPPQAVYAATKAGVVHFTRSCKPLAESHGVRVNCVCPGLVETPMVHESGDGEVADWLRPMYESVKLLEPEDIAAAVVRFVRDDTQVGEVVTVENPG